MYDARAPGEVPGGGLCPTGTPDAHDHWREKISQSPRLYSMSVAFATWTMANNCAVRRICRQGGVGKEASARRREEVRRQGGVGVGGVGKLRGGERGWL